MYAQLVLAVRLINLAYIHDSGFHMYALTVVMAS